jgi:hypothetical protein
MSQHEVSEFIVVAPAMLGKAVEWAEPMLLAHLAEKFPGMCFRIEPFGPFADEEEFTVIPIMNRPPEPGERTDKDQIYLVKLDPAVIPEIQTVLRDFDPDNVRRH